MLTLTEVPLSWGSLTWAGTSSQAPQRATGLPKASGSQGSASEQACGWLPQALLPRPPSCPCPNLKGPPICSWARPCPGQPGQGGVLPVMMASPPTAPSTHGMGGAGADRRPGRGVSGWPPLPSSPRLPQAPPLSPPALSHWPPPAPTPVRKHGPPRRGLPTRLFPRPPCQQPRYAVK